MPASGGNPLRVLICYGGLGIAYIAAPQSVSIHNPAYRPALRMAQAVNITGVYPMRLWGALLVVLSLGVAWSLRHPYGKSWLWSTGMCMYWTFWTVQFAAAAVGTHGGWAAPFYAAIPAWYAFDRATPPRRKG